MVKIITYKSQSVPVFCAAEKSHNYQRLNNKLNELEFDFAFRKKWKSIKSVEMVRNVAILQYNDGTKLYLEVS
ncbi:MAG TPA: hypothetical protein IAA29_09205 [Candidatus Paenibacillus intestinavium]|nr:hypothetical protein [Candidatus Paenibacillus intestinavium]